MNLSHPGLTKKSGWQHLPVSPHTKFQNLPRPLNPRLQWDRLLPVVYKDRRHRKSPRVEPQIGHMKPLTALSLSFSDRMPWKWLGMRCGDVCESFIHRNIGPTLKLLEGREQGTRVYAVTMP